MEMILNLIGVDPALFGKIVPIIVLLMGLLSSASVALNAVKKFRGGSAEDGAISFVDKLMSWGQKILDFFSGNVKH